jgi:molybdopterin-containing oxidoreductase family iron-sulfur binding subunit
MNLNGMSGDYYDYLKASSSSIIVGATWNKIVHDDGVYVGVSQALSAGSVDYSAAAGYII